MRALTALVALCLGGCDCKQSCFSTPVMGPGETNRNPGIVGRPYTVKLPVPGSSSSCGPQTFASSVNARVLDPNNAPIASTVAPNPLDGERAPAAITFTPVLPGPYHLVARFEPGFGLVQADVWIAADRSDAGVHALPVPYECARWDQLGEQIFCIAPDAGMLGVIVDGGVTATVPAYDFALAPELSGVWVVAPVDEKTTSLQLQAIDGGTLALRQQLHLTSACADPIVCSLSPCGPGTCNPGEFYISDVRLIDRSGTLLLLAPPNYGFASFDSDSGFSFRPVGQPGRELIPPAPFVQWGSGVAVAIAGPASFGASLCVLPFDGGPDCVSSAGDPAGATEGAVWMVNTAANTLDGLGLPAVGGPVSFHLSVSPPDLPTLWPAPDTAPHWTTQQGLAVLGTQNGDLAFDFFTLDLSDATWWGVDGKRLWKWSAATQTLSWIDR